MFSVRHSWTLAAVRSCEPDDPAPKLTYRIAALNVKISTNESTVPTVFSLCSLRGFLQVSDEELINDLGEQL